MKGIFLILFSVIVIGDLCAGAVRLDVVRHAENGKGMLCRLENKKLILLVEGSPEEMGAAHGQLLKTEIKGMRECVFVAAAGYLVRKDDWFFTRIEEVIRRTAPYTPERFVRECDAMSRAAGVSIADGRHMNFFPEMFHCSGVAVCNSASAGGQLIHARVLDYMSSIGLQDYSTVMVFLPENYNSWMSLGFAGFIGTVTAMNDKGLAMGEMGGNGEGKWDGLPMSFMMRRVMEECATVDEAVKLMQSTPLTCDYYYVISDKNRNMVAISAIAGEPLRIHKPGEQNPLLPPVPVDTVFISSGERAEKLSERLNENFGRITPQLMMEIIKRPVAMTSNLHNAVFLPETGTMYFAVAGSSSLACDEKYYQVNLHELLEFYSNGGKITQDTQVMKAH